MSALLLNVWDRIKSEPVLVTTLVGSVLSLLVVFGVPISDEQKTAVVVAVAAVLALFARSQVTPTSNPTLDQGTVVKVTTPKGQPDTMTVLA
jgi:hypothetical protein